MFDWSITLGNLIQIIGTVGGFAISGIAFVMLMRTDMKLLAQRVSSLEEIVKEMIKMNMLVVEQKGKITAIDERLNMVSSRLDNFINKQRR